MRTLIFLSILTVFSFMGCTKEVEQSKPIEPKAITSDIKYYTIEKYGDKFIVVYNGNRYLAYYSGLSSFNLWSMKDAGTQFDSYAQCDSLLKVFILQEKNKRDFEATKPDSIIHPN